MNVFFDWKYPTPVCLILFAVMSILAAGCGRSGNDVSQQLSVSSHVEPAAPDGQNRSEDIRLAEQLLQLRSLVDDAKQEVQQGDWNKAIETYTTVLAHAWPDSVEMRDVKLLNAEVYLLRGQAFLAKDFPGIAIEDFDDAIKLGDDELSSKAYVQRAKAVGELERWTRVVSDCTRAIRLQPSNGEAFLVRGQAFADMGKFNLARKSVLEAERLGIHTTFKIPIPEFASTDLDQAKSLLEAGSPVVAREILETALLKRQDSWETNGLLAQTHFHLCKFQRAIDASTRALRLNPRYADAYRIRGLSWFQRGYFDQTIADLDAAIALDNSLAGELNPYLTAARSRGGIDPRLRVEAVSQIRQFAAGESDSAWIPGKSERWLLDLFEMSNSSDQIKHLQQLLIETPTTGFDSLDWLADFLMLDRKVPAVNVLRTWLNRELPVDSPLEKRLRESVASRGAAASIGVNLFPDFAAYAIEYKYYDVLQTCIDLGICRPNIDHMHQAVKRADSRCLRLILPHTILVDRTVKGLLRHCVEKNKKDHARIIIDKYENGLTYQLMEFLGIAEEIEPIQKNGEPIP